MATPRSPYVCIGDALLDEPWPREMKLALVLLSCHMHVRWRSDRRLSLEDVARAHPIGIDDAMKITGKHRTDVAWKSLQRLADFVSMSIELRRDNGCDVAWISWPKWLEFNQSITRQRGASGAPESPSASASASASSSEIENTSEKRANASTSRRQPAAAEPPGPERTRRRAPSPEAFARVPVLAGVIRKSIPRQPVPQNPEQTRRWAEQLDLLHRLGPPGGAPGQGISWAEIDAVIAWLPTHQHRDFSWGRNVLSPRKLRTHFARLSAEMKRPASVKRTNWVEDQEEQTRRWLREIEGGTAQSRG